MTLPEHVNGDHDDGIGDLHLILSWLLEKVGYLVLKFESFDWFVMFTTIVISCRSM